MNALKNIHKVVLIYIFIANVFVNETYSQIQNKKYIFGIGIGNTLSINSHTEKRGNDIRFPLSNSLKGGVQVHHKLTSNYKDHLALRLALNYTNLRYGIVMNNKMDKVGSRYSLDIIELPICLTLGININDHTVLREFVGVSFNMLYERGHIKNIKKNNGTQEYEFNHFMLASEQFYGQIVSGLGLEWKNGRKGFYNINLLFHSGFKNLISSNLHYKYGNIDGTNSSNANFDLTSRGNYLSIEFHYFFYKLNICPTFF